jgi:hypothetical protein
MKKSLIIIVVVLVIIAIAVGLYLNKKPSYSSDVGDSGNGQECACPDYGFGSSSSGQTTYNSVELVETCPNVPICSAEDCAIVVRYTPGSLPAPFPSLNNGWTMDGRSWRCGLFWLEICRKFRADCVRARA